MYALHNFPIPDRELTEIVYDYIDKDLKPIFSLIFYTETVDEVKHNFVRVVCLRCCRIVKNSDFNDRGTERQWFKKTNYIILRCNPKIDEAIKKATYFEWINNNNKTVTGYYDFAQISSQSKFAIANIIFDDCINDIPFTFYNCMKGEC